MTLQFQPSKTHPEMLLLNLLAPLGMQPAAAAGKDPCLLYGRHTCHSVPLPLAVNTNANQNRAITGPAEAVMMDLRRPSRACKASIRQDDVLQTLATATTKAAVAKSLLIDHDTPAM